MEDTKTTYLILSGEGDWKTENRFVLQTDDLEEAEKEFERFKCHEYQDTDLLLFKAEILRRE